VQKNATTGQLTSTAVTTAAASDTFMTIGFYFDGERYVDLYKDDVKVATVDLTATLTTYLPDTELTVTFAIMNGEVTNSRVLTVDYIFVAQER
jgi:poly(3-hydroxyalkanoate) synthetase